MTVLLAVLLAFSSTEWFGRREIFVREAERLRAAYSNCAARADAPAEGVVVPIETHPNGAVKLVISARQAKLFLEENLIWAKGVLIQRKDPKGREISRLEAAFCVVDRETRSGWAEGPMRLRQEQTVLHGTDVYFSAPDEYVLSLGKSTIDSKDLKLGGAL